MNKNFLALLVVIALFGCEQVNQDNSSVVAASSSVGETIITQQVLDTLAESLVVNYRLVSNIPNEQCDQNKTDGNCFTVEMSLTSPIDITAKGWQIYFSHISPVQSDQSDEFTIEHVNGDLHRISLTDAFSGFKAGESKKLIFRVNFWMLSETDALPNYIISSENLTAKVIASTKVAVDKDTGIEYLPFVDSFTDVNRQFKRTKNDATQWLDSTLLYQRNLAVSDKKLDVSKVIIPSPKTVNYDAEQSWLDAANGFKVNFGNVKHADVSVALARLAKLGFKANTAGVPLGLAINADDSKLAGSYKLVINTQGIDITGVDANGVFNGLQSLASLVTINESRLPSLQVIDQPHYAFRGMLVDVARNFHSKAFILTLLDQMAAYKLNKLHLHLGDDEGWRLEIPGLPELTDIGSKRCFDPQEQKCLMSQLGAGVDSNTPVNGYYSVSDYQEILRAATARHIQVIPSLDMPGHSRAAIKSMRARYNKYQDQGDKQKANEFLLEDFADTTEYSSVQYYNDNTINVCLESSYAFVTEVMKQVKKIHQQVGHPLTRYHIGADETAGAWLASPACQEFIANNDQGVTDMKQLGAYFIERVAGILSSLDIETAGWSDGLSHTRTENMPEVVQANAWDVLSWGGHGKVHELANRNWQIVVSTPDAMYFDFPYEADPKEHGYYWASRQINTEKIFQFMPDNLPAHAEFWLDRQDLPYVADDSLQKDEQGNILSMPLAKGKKYIGLQGQLWSENTRTDDMAEYKVYPRLLALAERAWHLPTWALPYNHQGVKYSQDTHYFTEQQRGARDQAWRVFANALGQKELAKLELDRVDYRLPTVGAMIKDGKLSANIAFPGLTIEYQERDQQWQIYQKPVAISGEVRVRSRSQDGTRFGRILQVVSLATMKQ